MWYIWHSASMLTRRDPNLIARLSRGTLELIPAAAIDWGVHCSVTQTASSGDGGDLMHEHISSSQSVPALRRRANLTRAPQTKKRVVGGGSAHSPRCRGGVLICNGEQDYAGIPGFVVWLFLDHDGICI